MTSYVTTHHHHHRRTASLPRFDDGPSFGRKEDPDVFKVNVPHASRTTRTTAKGPGDDYWSKRSLTTARSGEMVSGETIRKTSEKQFQQDTAPLPSFNSASYPEYRFFTTKTTTSSTSKPPPPPLQKTSSFSSHRSHFDSSNLRSPFARETGRTGHGHADFDDGGLPNWEESFKKFDFSPVSPGKLMETDDWKKEFLHRDEKPAKRVGSGGGGPRGDLVFSRTTTTHTRGGGGSRPRTIGSQRGYVSDSEDSWNWLEEQRSKLEAKRAMRSASQEKLDLEEKLNRQRSEVEGRLLKELRASQSTLTRRTPESDLRYRARSVDNVGVNSDEYEVSYSKFGRNVQRKANTLNNRLMESQRSPAGTLRSGPSSPDVPSAFGYGRRAYQTLPRDARLPGTIPRPPTASSSTLGEQTKSQSFRSSGRNLSTGSLNRRKSQEDRDEEIVLHPIGPGIQPLESSANPASTLTRNRIQLTPRAELEREKSSDPQPIQLTPPTPQPGSTLTHSSASFRSARPETTHSTGTSSGPPIRTGNVPTGSNTSALRDDEVVVEQAISPSRGRSGEFPGSPSTGSDVDRKGSFVPQPVRTVVVSPEYPPHPAKQPPPHPQAVGSNGGNSSFSSAQRWQQHQWISTSDRPSNVQSGSSTNWLDHSSVNDDRNSKGMTRFAENQESNQRHFTIQPIHDGMKTMDVKVGQNQRELFNIQQNQQTTHEQQMQQMLMQQQQKLEQQIFEQQKQVQQQQQQLLEQQQQLQKQLEQHRLLQQQMSRTTQQQQPQQQQQFSYQKTDQLFQLQPRHITSGQQQEQQLQQEEQTYDLLQQRQPQQFLGQQQQQLQQQRQQQQQMQHHQHANGQNYVRSYDNHVAVGDNRGFKAIPQNSVSFRDAQSSASSFQGQGNAESLSGQPYYQSVPEARGESKVASPPFGFPFSVFQSGRDPLSPTGVSGVSNNPSGECKFEMVMPTYATPEKDRGFVSRGVDSSGGSGRTVETTIRTYQKTSTSGNVPSNGSGTSGFNAGSAGNQRYVIQETAQKSSVVPLNSTEYSLSQNLSNRPTPIQILPANGPSSPGRDGMISPESYWIQRSTAERSIFEGPTRNGSGVMGTQYHEASERNSRKNFSGTSSIEGSLTPLSVDLNRVKWTDATGQSSPSFHADRSSGGSLSSSRDGVLDPPNQMSIKFVKDMSHLWYKPQISREEVISSLKNKAVGSFLVRDSNTYPGSYALAVKVAAIPDNTPTKKFNEDPSEELVRHFLIEPTPTGVRLKGYKTETVFGSLAALIYQHSISPLSLPCRLLLPISANENGETILRSSEISPSADQLIHCAFNVLYIMSVGIELLSGPEAVDRAATVALEKATTLKTTVVNLKISQNGVTITDNSRSIFFRQHFPAELIRYCGLDRRLRCWTYLNQQTGQISKNKIFGIICRRSGLSIENECHLFAELDSGPSSASGPILGFINQIVPERNRK